MKIYVMCTYDVTLQITCLSFFFHQMSLWQNVCCKVYQICYGNTACLDFSRVLRYVPLDFFWSVTFIHRLQTLCICKFVSVEVFMSPLWFSVSTLLLYSLVLFAVCVKDFSFLTSCLSCCTCFISLYAALPLFSLLLLHSYYPSRFHSLIPSF